MYLMAADIFTKMFSNEIKWLEVIRLIGHMRWHDFLHLFNKVIKKETEVEAIPKEKPNVNNIGPPPGLEDITMDAQPDKEPGVDCSQSPWRSSPSKTLSKTQCHQWLRFEKRKV